MPKRSRKPDEVEMAFDTLNELIRRDEARDRGESIELSFDDSEPKKNPAAVALGRLGGLKGGKARAANMSAKTRSQSARKAAKARWSKKS
jgi:hypothetical protein